MPLTHEEIEKIQSMIQDNQMIKNATREELTTFIKVMATSLYDDEDFYGVDDYMRFINEIFKRNFDTKNTRLGINELKEEDKVFKNLRIAKTPDEQIELNKEAMEWAKEHIQKIKDEEYEYHERDKQEQYERDYNPEKHLIIQENRKAFVDGVLYKKVSVVEFEDSTKIICEDREDGNPKNEMIKVDELHYYDNGEIQYKTKSNIIWDNEPNFHELVENYKSLFKVKDDESNQEFVTILEISKGFVGDVHYSRILIGKDSQGKIKAVFKSEDDERTLFIVEYDEEKQKFNDYLDDEIVFEGCDEYNQRYIKIKNEKVKWCEDEFYNGMRLYTNKFSRPVGKSPQQLGWDCALEMDKVKSQFLKLNQQNFGSKI